MNTVHEVYTCIIPRDISPELKNAAIVEHMQNLLGVVSEPKKVEVDRDVLIRAAFVITLLTAACVLLVAELMMPLEDDEDKKL